MAHVQRGMRTLNISARTNQNSAQISTQIAMLAAWLIENPQLPDEEPSAEPATAEESAAEEPARPAESESPRPLFDFDEPANPTPDAYSIIDRESSGTALIEGVESATDNISWPTNVLPGPQAQSSVIPLSQNPTARPLNWGWDQDGVLIQIPIPSIIFFGWEISENLTSC